MGDRSAIEWTDASWTPIRARWFAPQSDGSGKERIGWHCEHVSEGCRNCYSEAINLRLGTGLPFKPDHRRREVRVPPNDPRGTREMRGDVTVFLDEKMLLQPLRWRRPRMIFVCSMTDLFADFVTDAMLDDVFAVMAACSRHPLPSHTFQVLTKRPQRMRAYLADPALPQRLARAWCRVGRNTNVGWTTLAWAADGEASAPAVWPLPNVWLGTSCEDQAAADARVPELLATPAAVRFVSAEPLLGPIDFSVFPRGPSEIDLTLKGRERVEGYWCNGLTGQRGVLMKDGRVFDAPDDFGPRLDWIIVGGESGPHARPMHPRWATEIRDQCAAAGVAFHFKQHGAWAPLRDPGDGEWPTDSGSLIRLTYSGERHDGGYPMQRVGKKAAGRLLDGVEHNGMPAARQFEGAPS